MKTDPQLSEAFSRLLEKLDASFSPDFQGTVGMIVAGGLAVNYYCGSRYTHDVDACFSMRFAIDPKQMPNDCPK